MANSVRSEPPSPHQRPRAPEHAHQGASRDAHLVTNTSIPSHARGERSFSECYLISWRTRAMACGLDVVVVGIEHKGRIVVRMIMRSDARHAVVLTTVRRATAWNKSTASLLGAWNATCTSGFVLSSPAIQKSGLPPSPKPHALFPLELMTSWTNPYPSGASACL